MILSKAQQEVVDAEGNVIISASAGAGKTRVLVEKIHSDIEKNSSHKTIAGITFTIKAADEIRERVNSDDEIFVGTNNSFVLEEIIKPFMKDVYGQPYNIDFDTEYATRKNTYKECLDFLIDKRAICSLESNYENFIFKLALDILSKSNAAQNYIKSKYYKWFIDEYQDTDQDMHNFFMFACDKLGIVLFIVGDDKQSIYGWRGAKAELFIGLKTKEGFNHLRLYDNFRSCQQIQNLSNILNEETKAEYKDIESNDNILLYEGNGENKREFIKNRINKENHSAVICKSNIQANEMCKYLNENGHNFVFIPNVSINDLTNKNAWFYFGVAEYILFKPNVYAFLTYVPAEGIENRKESKEYIADLKERFSKLSEATSDKAEFNKLLKEIAKSFGCSLEDANIEKLHKTIKDPDNKIIFMDNDKSNQCITIHSSKGKEFDEVYISDSDFDIYYSKNININNLYVAITRAKTKLFILTENIGRSKVLDHFIKIAKEQGIEPKNLLKKF